MSNKYLSELAKYLYLHNIINCEQELTKENYQEAIKKFQATVALPQTGTTNADTLWELQYPFVIEKPEYTIKSISVDTSTKFDCSSGFNIRNDCYDALQNAFKDIHEHGGLVFSSGSLRPLDAEVTPARSHTSLHYTGIALDLCINAGFTNPKTDPYVIVRERTDSQTEIWKSNDIYFRIYCRSTQGETKKLNAIYWTNHKSGIDLYEEVEDKFICITDIMMKYGFSTIPPRSGFLAETNRDYLSSEWWHFNGAFNIIHGFSQFGIELIKTFGLEKVENSPVWSSKKAIFNYSGFIMTDYIEPEL